MRELPEDGQAPRDPALEMHAALGDELAQEVWHVVLDCDDLGRKALKSVDKQKRPRLSNSSKKTKNKGGALSAVHAQCNYLGIRLYWRPML